MKDLVSSFYGAHLHVIASVDNTAPFEEMLQRWRAVGNTVFDLTGPRFEPQTSHSRCERATARPTGRFSIFSNVFKLS